MNSRPASQTVTGRSPDLVIALDADARTADAARYCVGTIARTAPAVRDRAELLTTALLAGDSTQRARRDSHPVELRVWSSAEPARVELAGPGELLTADADVLDEHADRWGVERDAGGTWVWFEVDGGACANAAPDACSGPLAAQPV